MKPLRDSSRKYTERYMDVTYGPCARAHDDIIVIDDVSCGS